MRNNSAQVININQGQAMPSKNGYVSIWRDIRKQDWYSNTDALAVFTHIMLTATSKPINYNFKGLDCRLEAGQFVSTYSDLGDIFNINKSKVRRLLSIFEKNGQITRSLITKGHINKGFVVTLTGWNKWQKTPNLSDTPPDTPSDTPRPAYLKGLDVGSDTLTVTPPGRVVNNNLLNNKEKEMLVSGETSSKVSYLEIREKAFEHFWKCWSRNKKLIGKSNTAPKNKFKPKFLAKLNDKHVHKIGVDGFRTEISLMCELATIAHADIARCKEDREKSSYSNYETMYPFLFLSNEQWRDCDDYRELSK